MTVDPDLTIIDDLGVTAVAKASDISREAVRQWRLKGTIPDQRRAELRHLVANDIGSDGRPGWPSLPTRLPMLIDQDSAGQSADQTHFVRLGAVLVLRVGAFFGPPKPTFLAISERIAV